MTEFICRVCGARFANINDLMAYRDTEPVSSRSGNAFTAAPVGRQVNMAIEIRTPAPFDEVLRQLLLQDYELRAENLLDSLNQESNTQMIESRSPDVVPVGGRRRIKVRTA